MKKDLHLCPKVKCPMNILVILRNIYSNPDLFDDEQYLCKRFSHYAFSDDQPTVIVVKDTGITEPRQNLLQSSKSQNFLPLLPLILLKNAQGIMQLLVKLFL